MKTGLVILLMISLVSCIKSDTFYKKLKYMTYKEFKENYFYSYDEHNMLVPSGFSLITIDNTLLLKFLKEKESNLKNLSEFKNSYINKLGHKDKIIQLGNLIIETNNQNKILVDVNISGFFRSLLKETEENIGSKEFYKVIEENFIEEEIYVLVSLLTYNSEFEYYEVKDNLGLKKIDKINAELGEKEEITEKEWRLRELKSYEKTFENEVSEIWNRIYLLADSRIIIVNDENEILKEIKIKNYKEIGFLVYKDILYVYSDKKIYEISLNNLNEMKIIEI